eukprot:Skav232977  [mRNA]  locus=scaffold1735:449643:458779:+ [translate_table: standard]
MGVYPCHEYLGIPNVSSSFGTAPDVWNWMFAACAKLLPTELLANRQLMQNVAVFSMPIITAVDRLVGARNAMRIDARSAKGEAVTLRITHEDLEDPALDRQDCVGLATAAFGLEVLEKRVDAGVWFPVAPGRQGQRSDGRAGRHRVGHSSVECCVGAQPFAYTGGGVHALRHFEAGELAADRQTSSPLPALAPPPERQGCSHSWPFDVQLGIAEMRPRGRICLHVVARRHPEEMSAESREKIFERVKHGSVFWDM